MGRDPRAGLGSRRLALSGLRRAAALGRPPRGQAFTGRLRLRPGSVGRALPLVPRPDRRALWTGAARGDRLGCWPAYLRGRPAPTWAKFTPSTMIVTRRCWG